MRDKSSKRWILFFFCCSSVLVTFNLSALNADIPQIGRALNIPVGDVANIIGYYMIPYGLCALLYAPLATRFSIKRLMIISTLCYAFANWMCLWSDSFELILVGRVIAGLGAAAVTPLALMTLGKIFDKKVHGRVIGLFFSASFLGSVLGLIVNGYCSWHWQFIIPALMGIVLGVGYIFCPNKGMEANTGVVINYFDVFKMGGLRRILILIFVSSMLFHGVVKWYGVYLDKIYNFDQAAISIIFIISSLAGAFGQNIGGFITDRLGRHISCYIGLVILGCAMMSLLGHYNFVLLAIILSLISIGWTIAHNGISTVLADFSSTYRSELAALNSAVRFFSGGIGFWVSGNFVQANFGYTFFGIGCLMLAQCAFIHKIIPKKEL